MHENLLFLLLLALSVAFYIRNIERWVVSDCWVLSKSFYCFIHSLDFGWFLRDSLTFVCRLVVGSTHQRYSNKVLFLWFFILYFGEYRFLKIFTLILDPPWTDTWHLYPPIFIFIHIIYYKVLSTAL